MRIVTSEEIRAVLPTLDVVSAIQTAFVRYSAGQAVVPPVGELLLEKGEVHIKYGYMRGEPYYVIKIASGFYGNPKIGLASSNGMMLLFSQETGELAAILLDEGYLTDVRTAVAGAVAAKYLAPARVERIGVIGTGVQARLQLEYLKPVVSCRDVLVWGRTGEHMGAYRFDMETMGFRVAYAEDTDEVLRMCNLVVTTTPSTEPLARARQLQSGTHITAVGSDTPHKQELESEILQRADIVVADSLAQCLHRGEIHQAIEAGAISQDKVVELGHVIAGEAEGRASESQITVADLTGVAVQDMAIAAAVFESVR
jgi:ornithine cyclodeaminase